MMSSTSLAVNLDTGNSWLGGSDPVDMVERFGELIQHVHWKDLDASWEVRRGTIFGCGMSTCALGDGVINIGAVVSALQRVGFDGHTTLEIAGDAAVLASRDYLVERGLTV